MRDLTASWVYLHIMMWRLMYRSALSLIGLCAFLGICWLVGNAVPEKVGKIIILLALLCTFPALFIAIGWIGQVGRPTDPSPRRTRRLREVQQCDSLSTQVTDAPRGRTGARRAA